MVGKTENYFYTFDEYNEWVEKNKGKKFITRYLKGLGSSTAQDFRNYFTNMDTHLIKIELESDTDLEVVDLVFGKGTGMADRRKVWLDLER